MSEPRIDPPEPEIDGDDLDGAMDSDWCEEWLVENAADLQRALRVGDAKLFHALSARFCDSLADRVLAQRERDPDDD